MIVLPAGDQNQKLPTGAFFNGETLIKIITGQPISVDLVERQKIESELREQLPHADIVVEDLTVSAKVKSDGNGGYLCMKCGEQMINRVNQKFDRKTKKWVAKKRNDNVSNWECQKCVPGCGGQVLMVARALTVK